MQIHESAENYLETILMLSERLPRVCSIDIVNELDYSKPSISVAMKNLRENGYINMDSEGSITLTSSGRGIAERIYERHRFFSDLLIRMGVDPDVATEDACRIEHDLSPESFRAFQDIAKRLEENNLL